MQSLDNLETFPFLVATIAPQLAETGAIGPGIGAIAIPSITSSVVSVGSPSLSLGGGGSAIIASSPTSFWDRLSSFQGDPVLQLTGIWAYDRELVWKVIFSVFFLYVGIILFFDGRYITNSIIRAVTAGRGKHTSIPKLFEYVFN